MKTVTLAEFFEANSVSEMSFTSTASGGVIRREADDNEVFENVTTNPAFWSLRGTVKGNAWRCLEEDLQHCCDYRGNSLLTLEAWIK